MDQLHKRFSDEQLKELLRRYLAGELNRQNIQQMLCIKKRQFFKLLERYRQDPNKFSIRYSRTLKTRSIDPAIEKNVLKELKETKKLIDHKAVPVKYYNYSFIQKEIATRYDQAVSIPTIIRRAKEYGFYLPRSKTKPAHDRHVITNHVGELIQHDASIHLWSPWAQEKWVLITSIDDFSRLILYAMFVLRESAWAHIRALEVIFTKFGLPLKFYADNHAIFRFVRNRDELHYKHHVMTDEVFPQWRQVLSDCQVGITYALSPQAKGKVERPYQWLQDHVVRLCARENVKTIEPANQILFDEVSRYNHRWVHSTTQEIPMLRYQRAIKENKSVFRPFAIPPPYQSAKDIFCLRMDRVVDNYRSISVNNLPIKFNHAPMLETVQLRIYPDIKTGLSEVRFWYKKRLLDIQQIKTELLLPVHF